MAEFKDRLKELRLANGMSQQELAGKLKVHPMTISGYERGVRRPDFEILDKLADKLNADMDYLLGASETNNGYPRHVIEASLPKHVLTREAEKRAQAYFKGMTAAQAAKAEKLEKMHQRILEAYDAALPQIKKAVLSLLDIEE
jgi:transcriptional regulator with XRE-family HTH domain